MSDSGGKIGDAFEPVVVFCLECGARWSGIRSTVPRGCPECGKHNSVETIDVGEQEQTAGRQALAARLRALHEQATPEPWDVSIDNSVDGHWVSNGPEVINRAAAQRDSLLTVELRNHLPLILRALEGK